MNYQEGETTKCVSDRVPPIEVIPINIDPDILNTIKRLIGEIRPDLKAVVDPMPVDVFIALPGNKVIAVSPEDEQTFVPAPNNMFVPRSLIPIALFVGEGSGASGYSVASKTKYRNWG